MSARKSSFKQLTSTPEGRRLLEQELLLVAATEVVSKLLGKKQVNRAELARRIGKSKAFVTQILRGRHNMTLRTLADLAWALEARVQLLPEAWHAEKHVPTIPSSWVGAWTALQPQLWRRVAGIPQTARTPVQFEPMEAA